MVAGDGIEGGKGVKTAPAALAGRECAPRRMEYQYQDLQIRLSTRLRTFRCVTVFA